MTDETVKIEIKDEFELEYFEDKECAADDAWWWKVTSTGNHEIVVGSDEGFASKSNAERNFELVQRALLSL